ncbi:hypothetical protein KSP39_PZI006355 [Platanthera zijinensis]|uniref:Uncharacterized protein n=1 Tax=Platanthera zijinensis TaxID=2320716 RepID=A0AAP0G9B2_9ASPA
MEEPGKLKRALIDASAGAISGAISRTVTSPLDVIKIRFQSQVPSSNRSVHFLTASTRRLLADSAVSFSIRRFSLTVCGLNGQSAASPRGSSFLPALVVACLAVGVRIVTVRVHSPGLSLLADSSLRLVPSRRGLLPSLRPASPADPCLVAAVSFLFAAASFLFAAASFLFAAASFQVGSACLPGLWAPRLTPPAGG